MASGGSSGRTSSGPRSFGSNDVLCAYDDFSKHDPSNGRRSDPSAKDFLESSMGRPLVSVYGQQDEYPKEEIINAVEKCMKKYADNLLRHLEGISGRLSQLEIYCYKLERSICEFRADMIRDQSDADTKLKSLEKHLQEVHRSIQIIRDKQELAETQKELSKLQLAPKVSSTLPQKSEERVAAPSPVSEPKRHDDVLETPNHHLALALPHHIPPPTSLPANQLAMQQAPLPQQAAPASLGTPHDCYDLPQPQPAPYYHRQRPDLQPETHYIQPRPHSQESTQQQQSDAQTPQTFPQYQQQWTQPAPQQQFTQQVQQHASQPQPARPRTPPTCLPYPRQPANPETFAYAPAPQSGGNRTHPVPFGYGGSGSAGNISAQPQQQASSQTSVALPPAKASGGYMSSALYPPQSNTPGYNTVYSIDGSRVQTYPSGSYPPPSNDVHGMQNQQLPPSGGGFHRHGTQLMRAHPYADMIEKAAGMGFSRDHVVGVVNMMAESGQPVDFNALLDRLSSCPAAGPPRAWAG